MVDLCYLLEYSYIIVALFIAMFLSIFLIIFSYFIVYQKSDSEKSSAYECGFQPFEDARSKFDIRFYLVAILFIIFDLEIMFLFPWSIALFFIYLVKSFILFMFSYL